MFNFMLLIINFCFPLVYMYVNYKIQAFLFSSFPYLDSRSVINQMLSNVNNFIATNVAQINMKVPKKYLLCVCSFNAY